MPPTTPSAEPFGEPIFPLLPVPPPAALPSPYGVPEADEPSAFAKRFLMSSALDPLPVPVLEIAFAVLLVADFLPVLATDCLVSVTGFLVVFFSEWQFRSDPLWVVQRPWVRAPRLRRRQDFALVQLLQPAADCQAVRALCRDRDRCHLQPVTHLGCRLQ